MPGPHHPETEEAHENKNNSRLSNHVKRYMNGSMRTPWDSLKEKQYKENAPKNSQKRRMMNQPQNYGSLAKNKPMLKFNFRNPPGQQVPKNGGVNIRNDPNISNVQTKLDTQDDTFEEKTNLQRSHDQRNEIGAIYAELRKQRPMLRQKYILEKKIDDPSKKYKIEDARSLVGECNEMCPEYERYEREFQNGLMIFEKIPGTNRVDHKKAVKRYRRSAADDEAPLPCDIRPLDSLERTLDYLFCEVINEYGLEESHGFVRDRTRAIRKDLTVQNLSGLRTIAIYEKIARYHLICTHSLCHVIEMKQEYEQLEKTLQSLIELYNEALAQGIKCPNEAEFRTYYLLHYAYNKEVQVTFERTLFKYRPELLLDQVMLLAIQIRGFLPSNLGTQGGLKQHGPRTDSGNFGSFFNIFEILNSESFSYLMGCAFHPHINGIRHSALKSMNKSFYVLPSRHKESLTLVSWLQDFLFYDSTDELLDDLAYLNIETLEVDGTLMCRVGKIKEASSSLNNKSGKADSQVEVVKPAPKLKTYKKLIGSKISGASFVDIIYSRTNQTKNIENNVERNVLIENNFQANQETKTFTNTEPADIATKKYETKQDTRSQISKSNDSDANRMSGIKTIQPESGNIYINPGQEMHNFASIANFKIQPKPVFENGLEGPNTQTGPMQVGSDKLDFEYISAPKVETVCSRGYVQPKERLSENEPDKVHTKFADTSVSETNRKLSHESVHDIIQDVSRTEADKHLENENKRLLRLWRDFVRKLHLRNAVKHLENKVERDIMAISGLEVPLLVAQTPVFPDKTRESPYNNRPSWWAEIDSTYEKIDVAECIAEGVIQGYKKRYSCNSYSKCPSHLKILIYTPNYSKIDKVTVDWLKFLFFTNKSRLSENILQLSYSEVSNMDYALDVVVTHMESKQLDSIKILSGVRMIIFGSSLCSKHEKKSSYLHRERKRLFEFATKRFSLTNTVAPTPMMIIFWSTPDVSLFEYQQNVVSEKNISILSEHYKLAVQLMEIPFDSKTSDMRNVSKILKEKIKRLSQDIHPEPIFEKYTPGKSDSLVNLLAKEVLKMASKVSLIMPRSMNLDLGYNIKAFNTIIEIFNDTLKTFDRIICSEYSKMLDWPPFEFTDSSSLVCISGKKIPLNFYWNKSEAPAKISDIILKSTLCPVMEKIPTFIPNTRNLEAPYHNIYSVYANWVSSATSRIESLPASLEQDMHLELFSIISEYSKRSSEIIPFPYDRICKAVIQAIILQLEYKLSSFMDPIPYPKFALNMEVKKYLERMEILLDKLNENTFAEHFKIAVQSGTSKSQNT